MNLYDLAHVALMKGFLWLGVVLVAFVALALLVLGVAWANDRWQRRGTRKLSGQIRPTFHPARRRFDRKRAEFAQHRRTLP